jgi:hypothetical protein
MVLPTEPNLTKLAIPGKPEVETRQMRQNYGFRGGDLFCRKAENTGKWGGEK